MGMGYSLVCRKCGYSRNLFAGCGMMYHHVLSEKTEEARSGVHGEKLKLLFEQYPNGCIDAMNEIYYCAECRTVECESSLDFYKPKDSGRSADDDVFGRDMSEYELVEKHQHLCPKCGSPMKNIMRLTADTPVDCPECGSEMENGHMLMWN
ncbi:MAG: hypothetical protein IJM51_09105 [Clostridia bacterium]|nr:hypothetical protein [Clostridia bacterium]